MNPAITFCFCLYRGLPWRRFPIYFLAQFLGGFVAAGVVYANYITAIDNYEGHNVRTVPPSKTATGETAIIFNSCREPAWLMFHEGGVFCTYPQAFLTKTSQFFSEFITATILMFVIFALKDESNRGAMGKTGAGPFFPLALFFLIFGLGACFGFETGYAINLARDFGPRLMSYAVGYGHEVWSAGGYYFWSKCISERYFLKDTETRPINRVQSGARVVCIFVGEHANHNTCGSSNGCLVPWVHLRRLPLRFVHLHRTRKPHQHPMAGAQTVDSATSSNQRKREFSSMMIRCTDCYHARLPACRDPVDCPAIPDLS